MGKIFINEEIFKKAISDEISIDEALKDTYGEEISKRVRENAAYEKLTPTQMAMKDAGLTKNSTIKEFYRTSDNEWLFPAVLETVVTDTVNATPILNEIIASTKTTPSADIRTLNIDFTSADAKKALTKRAVAEGAELPEVTINRSAQTLRIFKRGIAVKTSYEAIQDSTLNMFLETIKQGIAFSAHQQVGDAIKTLVEGDGNKNPADATTTTAESGIVTADDITEFLVDFMDGSQGANANTLICGKEAYKMLAKMFVNNDQGNGYRPGATFKFPQTMFNGLTVIYDSRVPDVNAKKAIIAIDNKQALDKYVVANSIINEFARDIRTQTEIGTLSERIAFGKRNPNATKILTIK